MGDEGDAMQQMVGFEPQLHQLSYMAGCIPACLCLLFDTPFVCEGLKN